MHLVLVRHALPERIDPDAVDPRTGKADPGLTELGRRQAERLAKALAEPAPDAVYTSTMTRAV